MPFNVNRDRYKNRAVGLPFLKLSQCPRLNLKESVSAMATVNAEDGVYGSSLTSEASQQGINPPAETTARIAVTLVRRVSNN